MVDDVEEQKLKKSVKKSKKVRWRVWKLKEKEIKRKFEERVMELVDIDSMDFWGSYQNRVLQVCDKLCGKTKVRGDRGNTWWGSKGSNRLEKESVQIVVLESICGKENRKARNETKEIITKAMKQKAEEKMSELFTKPNDVFKFLKFMKKKGRNIEGGGCTRDKDGRLTVNERDHGKLWKEHMEKIIMNVENDRNQIVEVDKRGWMEAMNKIKLGKAAGPSEVNMDMIIASGKLGVGVIKKLCLRVLDGKGMSEEWKTSVVVSIFKGKGDAVDCGTYRGVKLLQHAMKIVERVMENRIRGLAALNDLQFGFMPGKGTTHT